MDEPSNLSTEQRIYGVVVTLVFKRAGLAAFATVMNASILTIVLWPRVSHRALASWLALTWVAALGRFVLIRKFRNSAPPKDFARWANLFILGLAISGAIWGSSAIFLFPVESVAHQAFIAFALAGMVGGAVGVFSVMMGAFLAFSIPALVPIIIRFLMVGDGLHLAMATMTVLFAVLNFAAAIRINAASNELIFLKETFAEQLKARTIELIQMNKRYRQEIAERKLAEQALKSSEAQIEKSLQEKTLLLQEIHHRVKNNMQVIVSLLYLQAAQIEEAGLKEHFEEASTRVNAMALIHNILYESSSISEVFLDVYFRRLTDSLIRMYDAYQIDVRIQTGQCHLNMDQAIPCGLIINELISNALKHAFPGHRQGHIRITADASDHDQYVITVADNGVGLPDHIDFHHASTLGLKLVRGLVMQELAGRIEVDRSQGTRYQIYFRGTRMGDISD